MSEEEITIADANMRGANVFRVTVEDGKTYIRDYATGAPMYVIDGEIGGGVKTMTTAERTAITPDAGALIYDSDQDVLYLGDGVTPGGNALSGSGGGDYIAGRWIDIAGGATISEAAYEDIETVDVSGASPSVTMKPGHAYSINATTKAVTLNTEVFSATKFGKEGHLQIFVAGTGYVVTGANVVLKEPLEPDSINNCTVRFHGGSATISVEDHIGGYIVTAASGSTAGTLQYGLASAGSSYIAFNDTLAGQTIDMGGVVTNGEKHVVGNGYADTIVTGGLSCTSKTTFANLSMQNVSVLGGTMTLGDAYIPSGSTVSVSGGGLSIERVRGAGTIDLNSTFVSCTSNTVEISGTTFNNGSKYCLQMSGASVRPNLTSCTFGSGTFGTNQGAIWMTGGSAGGANPLIVSGCSFVGNGNYFTMATSAAVIVSSCYFAPTGSERVVLNGTTRITFVDANLGNNNIYTGSGVTIGFSGYCKFGGTFTGGSTRTADVIISSGATVDLTGNTNTTPINPVGGITFGANVTVVNSAGTSVLLNGGEAGTCNVINNDGTTE